MRKSLVVVILIVFTLIVQSCGRMTIIKEPTKSMDFEGLDSSELVIFIDQKIADVNGDNKKELVRLSRDMTNNSSNIKLCIKSDKEELLVGKQLCDSGIAPSLSLVDLNGDSVKDIFVYVPTGGSSGDCNYWLISFVNNVYSDIKLDGMDPTKYIQYVFNENTVTVQSDIISLNKEYDLTDKNREMLKELKADNKEYGSFSPEWLAPIDFDNDGVSEIQYKTFLNLIYRYPVLKIEIIFKYKDGIWDAVDLKIDSI